MFCSMQCLAEEVPERMRWSAGGKRDQILGASGGVELNRVLFKLLGRKSFVYGARTQPCGSRSSGYPDVLQTRPRPSIQGRILRDEGFVSSLDHDKTHCIPFLNYS